MESGTAALVPILSEIARVTSETLDLDVVRRISLGPDPQREVPHVPVLERRIEDA